MMRCWQAISFVVVLLSSHLALCGGVSVGAVRLP